MPSRGSKLSLFLMELIVVIFFFSLSAAVCVRLFSAAHILSEDARNMTNAAMWSQNLCEVFMGQKGDVHEISQLYPNAFVSEAESLEENDIESVILFFDNDWEMVDSELSGASYEAILEVELKKANEVYSDITEYGVEYKGEAAIGDIAVIDIRGLSDNVSRISDAGENLILREKVDIYLGEEDDNE